MTDSRQEELRDRLASITYAKHYDALDAVDQASIDTLIDVINQQVLSALEEVKSKAPFATSTPEELDKANNHLDSRSQQYWSAYNKGYISMSNQTKAAIDAVKEKYQ